MRLRLTKPEEHKFLNYLADAAYVHHQLSTEIQRFDELSQESTKNIVALCAHETPFTKSHKPKEVFERIVKLIDKYRPEDEETKRKVQDVAKALIAQGKNPARELSNDYYSRNTIPYIQKRQVNNDFINFAKTYLHSSFYLQKDVDDQKNWIGIEERMSREENIQLLQTDFLHILAHNYPYKKLSKVLQRMEREERYDRKPRTLEQFLYAASKDFGDRHYGVKRLGIGAFMEVFLITDDEGRYDAGKRMRPGIDDKFFRQLRKELLMSKDEVLEKMLLNSAARIRHPNICLLYAQETSQSEGVWFREELIDETFEQLMNRFTAIGGVPDAKGYLLQLATGYHKIHQEGLCHLDGKLNNYGYSFKQRQAKLLDFGIATIAGLRHKLRKEVGGILNRPPEMYFGYQPTKAADMYMYSKSAYEFITGVDPFLLDEESKPIPKPVQEELWNLKRREEIHDEFGKRIISQELHDRARNYLLKYHNNHDTAMPADDAFKNTIMRGMHPDPNQRPTFEELLNEHF